MTNTEWTWTEYWVRQVRRTGWQLEDGWRYVRRKSLASARKMQTKREGTHESEEDREVLSVWLVQVFDKRRCSRRVVLLRAQEP